ncbi:b(0,+)-type amino acid transporter 1-like isoform X2 [Physella acuta]|nr:b(0,+)-type amino acid transporter 1-like isoform X2 [Physella acuta]
MCAALCFAELRESVKREGVEYAYITEAFGPLAGFVYSWMRIVAAEPCSTAVFALAFTDYVADAVYDECGPPATFLIVVASIAVLTMALVNVMSTKLSENLQMLASVGKVTALSVIIVMGVKRMVEGHVTVISEGMKSSRWSPTDLAFACYNGLWAYGGWSNVNHVTSGIKKPPRNVPRIVKTIIPLVLVLYLLTVLSFFTVMTRDQFLHARGIGVRWAEDALGPASSIISISVGLIALGSVNATFLSSGRLSGVAAKNGQIPDVVSWVHVRSKTPIITVALRCVIAIVVMCVADGQELLRFYIFTVWLFHGSSILALLILRVKNKNKKRPYKVDLWVPVVVVLGIGYLLLAPFLQYPKREFIAALVLIGTSIISYYPINWLKSKKVINIPDQLVIWLQLFLRIAPKRDLRRERRSFLRTMGMLARDSIIITPNVQSDPAMRRFSRRMSMLAKAEGSPALLRRLDETAGMGLRHRIHRTSSLAEADINGRLKSEADIPSRLKSSVWSLEGKASPAIIRKKAKSRSNSFNQSDLPALRSPPSLPILKNRYNTTQEAGADCKPGSLAPSTLPPPHHVLRPQPSPIPEEESANSRAMTQASSNNRATTQESSNNRPLEQESEPDHEHLQVIAGFESDGGGEYEVLARPEDARRFSTDVPDIVVDGDTDSSSSSDSDSGQAKNKHLNIFSHILSSSSSLSSDSSMEEEGSDDEPEIPSHKRYYISEDEEMGVVAGHVNKGHVNKALTLDDEQVSTI